MSLCLGTGEPPFMLFRTTQVRVQEQVEGDVAPPLYLQEKGVSVY